MCRPEPQAGELTVMECRHTIRSELDSVTGCVRVSDANPASAGICVDWPPVAACVDPGWNARPGLSIDDAQPASNRDWSLKCPGPPARSRTISADEENVFFVAAKYEFNLIDA